MSGSEPEQQRTGLCRAISVFWRMNDWAPIMTYDLSKATPGRVSAGAGDEVVAVIFCQELSLL